MHHYVYMQLSVLSKATFKNQFVVYLALQAKNYWQPTFRTPRYGNIDSIQSSYLRFDQNWTILAPSGTF